MNEKIEIAKNIRLRKSDQHNLKKIQDAASLTNESETIRFALNQTKKMIAEKGAFYG